jgi:hypothetical protein
MVRRRVDPPFASATTSDRAVHRRGWRWNDQSTSRGQIWVANRARKLAVAGIGRVTRDAGCERRRISWGAGRDERIWRVCHCLRRSTGVASRLRGGRLRVWETPRWTRAPRTSTFSRRATQGSSHASHLIRSFVRRTAKSRNDRSRWIGCRARRGCGTRRRRRRTRRDPPDRAPAGVRRERAVDPGHPTPQAGDRWSPRSPQGEDLNPVSTQPDRRLGLLPRRGARALYRLVEAIPQWDPG